MGEEDFEINSFARCNLERCIVLLALYCPGGDTMAEVNDARVKQSKMAIRRRRGGRIFC